MNASGPVGLYSISVSGLDVPDLLAWAGGHGIPFLHLRGGPRGFALARRDEATLRGWRCCAAQAGVPITGVTADLDLADLLAGSATPRATAREELFRLADAAAMVGAGWVRLLARTEPRGRYLAALRTGEVPDAALPLLLELHHPRWLAPAAHVALESLMECTPRLRLLADSAQLTAALPEAGQASGAVLETVLARVEVLHLSDDGTGFHAGSHDRVAQLVARRVVAGVPVEVAVEWTGTPRTTTECLTRYRAASAWWHRLVERAVTGARPQSSAALRVVDRSPKVTSSEKPPETEQRTMPHPTATSPSTTRISEILAEAYGLTGAWLRRLDGQVSVNYRAQTSDGRVVFVKHYVDDADLAAAPGAIAQTQLAGKHGVPVAAVLPSCDGEPITRQGDIAVSVWEWMPGHIVEDGLNPAQQAAAGRTLGRIHAAFADHPASPGPSPKAERWLHPDLAKRHATIDQLLTLVNECTDPDAFDQQAAATLEERRVQLHRLPALLAELPPLHTQVLHGDYSPKNLHFDGDALTAVVDFGPPEPFLAAYELGRIAFDPRSVLHNPDWITAGITLVTAYLDANPRLPAADVRSCARVALLQLAGSLYGVKEHYLKPGLHQDDLDRFWVLRHQAATRLLHHLDEVETALATAAGSSRPLP